MSFWQKNKNTILSGAMVIGFASFLSRLLGLFRDRLFAEKFGASDLLDAYYAAFRVPDFVYNLLILGALSSAFIPVFIEYLNKNKEEAYRVASTVFNLTVLTMLVISGAIFIFVPYLVTLIAPGFSKELLETTSILTRIMLLPLIFFGISNIFSGVLNSFKRFVAYSLAPILYNVGIIIGALFFVEDYGIYGLAFGVALGSFMHMIIQLPSFIMTGFKYKFVFSLYHRGVVKIGKLMGPRILGLAVSQINLWVITVIASMQGEGGISVFNFANNLQYIPIGIFGISFAVSSFPYLAESFAKNNIENFKNHISATICKILFFVVPISAILIIERAQVVRLVLGAGNFDWEDTYLTAQSLGIFAISIFAQALIPFFARSFYAIQDTKTPVIISVVSVAANIAFSLLLVKEYDILGLAAAFTISSFINAILLIAVLRIKVGDINDNKILICILKIIISSAVMGMVVYISLNLVSALVDMQTYWGILVQAGSAASFGILMYIARGYILKLDELKSIKELFKLK